MDFYKLCLDDAFEVAAVWWLPSNPESTVHGVLSFSQDAGAMLRLHGVFDAPELRDPLAFFNRPPFEADQVLGKTSDGNLVIVKFYGREI